MGKPVGVNLGYISKDFSTADIVEKEGRKSKETDILIFDRIGPSAATQGKEGALHRGVSNSSLGKKILNFFAGRVKANDQAVYDIFRTHGMSHKQAVTAVKNVKQASKEAGLSGLSAAKTKFEIDGFKLKNQPNN